MVFDPCFGVGQIRFFLKKPGGEQVGSWRPDGAWSNAGGRVYTTAMAALSLQADDRAQRTLALLQGPR